MINTSARIYIQVRETGEIIQLDDFISITTMNAIRGDSTASVEIVNKADKWYNFRSRKDRRQTDVAQFIGEVYKRPLFRDINRAIREYLSEALKNNDNEKLMKAAMLEEFMIFDLMYRIWIDFRGRDNLFGLSVPSSSKLNRERWYAGFTGLLTSTSESYTPGKSATINLTGNDMMKLLMTTKVVTSKGIKPIANSISDIIATYRAYENSFSGYFDGAAIIGYLLESIERTFHSEEGSIYPGRRFWKIPDVEKVFTQDGKLTVGAGGAVPWAQKVLKRTYEGLSHIRPTKGILGLYRDSNFLNNMAFKDFYSIGSLKTKKADVIKIISAEQIGQSVANVERLRTDVNDPNYDPNYDPGEESVLKYLEAEFAIDKMIRADSGSSSILTNPYPSIIRSSFNFESQRLTCAEVLRSVAEVMNYNAYFDAAGNLIYQKCRYDDFPGWEAETDYDSSENGASRGYGFVDGTNNLNEPLFAKLGKGKYSKEHGLDFHGRNYVIGDESLVSWTLSKDDSNVLTHVAVPQAFNYFQIGSELQRFGIAGTISNPDLERKFGFRMITAPAILSNDLGDNGMAELVAEGILRRANNRLETCNLVLNARPDLQLGRTLYLMERRRLFYITSIQQQVIWGQQFRTIVKGEYGHHATAPIGDPWQLAMFGDRVLPIMGGQEIPPLPEDEQPVVRRASEDEEVPEVGASENAP